MTESAINLVDLIQKHQKYIDSISGKNENEIFANFYETVEKNIIQKWIEEIFNKNTIKNEVKSTEFRNLGNKFFKQTDYDLALKNYSESLKYAPYNSENFSLALANRSAVFYAKNNYYSCIKDANLCLEKNYAHNLKYKIYLRLINSYSKIFNFEKAVEILEIIKIYLSDDNLEINEIKKDEILHEINEIETEIAEKKTLEKKEKNIEKNNYVFCENSNFAYASNSISLKYNEKSGRHVIANSDINTGDILFLEKPFSFVPILAETSSFETVCYHCFSTTDCPIPCENCATQFCNLSCLKNSWENYHRFECTGSCVEIWPQIGVNYLATRILVLGASSGYKNVFNGSQTNVEIFGNKNDNYDYVCSLVSNVDKMDKHEIFSHVVSALVIITYLEKKTDFFQYVSAFLNKSDSDTPIIRKEDLPVLLGGVLLKHILQIIANASTIESVKPEFYQMFNNADQINDTGYYFSGVALYPSTSMMNHSCNANITNYFIKNQIVVKAKYNIEKGAEIFNSYGYDCRKQVTIGRKTDLKKQHYFDCDCTACTVPSMPEIFHEGLLCKNCSGLSLPKNDELYECTACSHEFNAKNHFTYIKKAENLFEKFEKSKNIDELLRCFELRQKVFYKYNFSIYTANLDLQTFYGENGDIKKWWMHTQKSLEQDNEILGKNSLRSALNIRLCLLILLRYLTTLSIVEKNSIQEITLIDMISNANNMFEQMKNIFPLFYDEKEISFDEINELILDANAIATHILSKKLCDDVLEEDIDN